MVNHKSFAKQSRGLTLAELLVGVAILSMTALVAGSLMTDTEKKISDSRKTQGVISSLHTVSGALQKFMSSGDIRFFAFSGKTSDQTLARFLIPQPGKCRDRSTADCSEQTSMLYIHYDKTTAPAITSICALDAQSLIVDMGDESYGPSTYDSANGIFSVSSMGASSLFATGDIPIDDGTLVSLMNPPKATLWVAIAKPQVFAPSQDGSGNITYDGGTTLPDTCKNNLKDDTANPPKKLPKKLIDKLVRVKVKPYILTEFTGGTSVSDPLASMGSFPMRIFRVQIRAVGPKKLIAGEYGYNASSSRFDFAYSDCALDQTAKVVCASEAVVRVSPVARVTVDESFALSLFDTSGNPVAASRFELFGSGYGPGSTCPVSTTAYCSGLKIADNGSISVLFNTGETFDKLNASGFSLLKQESLSNLRFRIQLDSANSKEEEFSVHFN